MLPKINLRCFGSAMPLFLFDADDGAGSGGEVTTPAPETSEAPGSENGPGGDAGTPNDTSPEGDGTDYQSRYENMRSEFDRRGTELQSLKQFQEAVSGAAGPEAQAQALLQLGIDLEDEGTDEEDFVDPDEQLDQVTERLNRMEESGRRAEQQQQLESYVDGEIDALEEAAGREFTEQELEFLVVTALQNPTEQGLPDVQKANESLQALTKGLKQHWMDSKQSGREPGSGVPAVEQVDLNDPEARVEFMAQKIDAAQRDV